MRAWTNIRIVTPAGDMSVELEDSLVNPSANGWSHSGNSVSARRSWSPTACAFFRSPRTWVWCSVACTVGPKRACVCRFYNRLSNHFFMRYEQPFSAQFTQRKYRGWVFQKFNLNKRVQVTDTFCCFFSRMSSSTGSHYNWWSLRRFESFLVLLESDHFLLIIWSEAPESTMNSSSLSKKLQRVKMPCWQDLAWRTCVDSQNTNLKLCASLCKIQAAILAVSSKFKVYSNDSISMSLILRSSLDDSQSKSWFLPCANVLVREMLKVSLERGSCHPTELSVITSVSHHSMECEYQSMRNFTVHQQVLLCVCVHTCRRICIHLELWILHFREHANNYMNHSFGNFLSSILYKVVCSLSLTDFYQSILLCL